MREGIAAAQQAARHGERRGRDPQSCQQRLSEIGQRAIGVVEGEERNAATSARLQELGKADKSIALIAQRAEDGCKVIDRDDHVGEAIRGSVAPMHRSWPVPTKAGSGDESRPASWSSSNCYTRTTALATPAGKVFATGHGALSNLSTTTVPCLCSCNGVPNVRAPYKRVECEHGPLHPNDRVGYNGQVKFIEGGT